jgi:hypothetical protein
MSGHERHHGWRRWRFDGIIGDAPGGKDVPAVCLGANRLHGNVSLQLTEIIGNFTYNYTYILGTCS